MKHSKLLLSFTIIFFYLINLELLSANNNGLNTCTIYNAYIHNDMHSWKKSMEKFYFEYHNTQNLYFLYESAKARYGLIGFYIGSKQYSEAELNIKIIEIDLDLLTKAPEYASSAYALKAGINGMKIGIHPIKAVYLGQFNQDYIKASFDLDNNNPIVWMEKGNSAYHTPAFFGGSYSGAIEYFEKAVGLFENKKHLIKCNWFYLHCLIWLGKSYEMKNEFVKAVKIYEKILKLEPELNWVKNSLYPEAKKKVK